MKGLTLVVYREADGSDYTNGGMTSRVTRVTVTGVRYGWTRTEGTIEPLPEHMRVFEPTDSAPEVTLVIRDNGCIRWLNVEPVADPPEGHMGTYMMGGNFAGTCDSRFTELTGSMQPVAVHDRSETWAQYDRLSR